MTKWLLSTSIACILVFCLPGFTQTQTGNENSAQTGSQNSGQTEQQMQGCIVHQGSYYFLRSAQSAPVRLQWSDQVSKNEGHQVRVEAHRSTPNQQETVANNGTTPHKGVTNGPSGDQASTSKVASEGDFVVDKLEVVAVTCPGGTKPNSEQP